MGIWQIIYLCLVMMGIGMHLTRHGEEYTTKYNFWAKIFYSGINIIILYFGGFFN